MPRIGAFREQLQLQTQAATPDGQGGLTGDWTDTVTVAAELLEDQTPPRAYETLRSSGLQDDVRFRFRVWRIAAITSAMRARWAPSWPPDAVTQTLSITGVVPEGTGYLLIDTVQAPNEAAA
jgi:head-tail adaptor